jgi:hypothetical protein
VNQSYQQVQLTELQMQDTPPTFPPPPIQLSPADGATGVGCNVTLTWTNNVLPADSFRVRWSTDPEFETDLHYSPIIKDTLYTLSNLNGATTYYWSVRGKIDGGWKAYTEPAWSYTTLNTPALSGAIENGSDDLPHPKLTWTSVAGAQSYKLYGYICPGTTDCDTLVTQELRYEGTDTTYLDSGYCSMRLRSTGPLRYYVRAVGQYGTMSNKSNKVGFQQLDCNAFKTTLKEQKPTENIPTVTRLHDCYPNPFNPKTVIRFELSEDSHVKLTVIDALGREVATLVEESQASGYKSVEFNASSLPSGVYFYRLTAVPSSGSGQAFTEMKKMLLAK